LAGLRELRRILAPKTKRREGRFPPLPEKGPCITAKFFQKSWEDQKEEKRTRPIKKKDRKKSSRDAGGSRNRGGGRGQYGRTVGKSGLVQPTKPQNGNLLAERGAALNRKERMRGIKALQVLGRRGHQKEKRDKNAQTPVLETRAKTKPKRGMAHSNKCLRGINHSQTKALK